MRTETLARIDDALGRFDAGQDGACVECEGETSERRLRARRRVRRHNNFGHVSNRRVHQTLRVTPAMEAGVTDHVWSVEEIVALLD
jgi:RNA polymerase-binding transcription factor DksA